MNRRMEGGWMEDGGGWREEVSGGGGCDARKEGGMNRYQKPRRACATDGVEKGR